MSIAMQNQINSVESRIAEIEKDREPVGTPAKLAELERRVEALEALVKSGESAPPAWFEEFRDEIMGEIQGLKMRMGKKGVFGG
jgi:hypothetical protein